MQQICEIIGLVKNEAKENFVPIVREETLQVLKQTLRQCGAENILEIGTATGYSALNMLSCTKAKLTTLEKNEEITSVTVNGWLSEVCENIPEVNFSFDYENISITVTEADEQMTHEIVVKVSPILTEEDDKNEKSAQVEKIND